ncbi:cob(I)alamin adenosyltransferase [Sphingomonas japonica]|uniref:Corrinoid adenosyltransferase n=1 Tax=Sphingomonas japonica TaxID=511662 RepID=A0ABX0TZQ9_9SPHN|nr:cob(I)alamin adenosyltransferase [Sphingomonas japonica]
MSKADLRMAAIGDVDEANSALGVAIAVLTPGALADLLTSVQNDLFDLGADIATPGDDFAPSTTSLRIVQAQVDRIEAAIDFHNAALEPLTSFILPGGAPAAAALHLARSIVRRAERSLVAACSAMPVNPVALTYVNRLSDLLFIAARAVNKTADGDVLWVPGASRA